jgi:hypothetical protein
LNQWLKGVPQYKKNVLLQHDARPLTSQAGSHHLTTPAIQSRLGAKPFPPLSKN